jgi:hypothetical protein
MLACNAALWGRQPDEWDMQWEQEENARRQQTQQVSQNAFVVCLQPGVLHHSVLEAATHLLVPLLLLLLLHFRC